MYMYMCSLIMYNVRALLMFSIHSVSSLGSQLCIIVQVRGGKHLKLGKAWDETSREGRCWVDMPACAAVYLIHILTRSETFNVRGL